MSPWSPLDFSLCPLCGGNGLFPLTDVPGRTDYAVCGECKAGKAWRYAEQIDKRGKTHAVTPQWIVYAAEHKIPVRVSGKITPGRSAIDLWEHWQRDGRTL